MIYINGRFLSQSITGVQRFAKELTVELLNKSDDYKLLALPGTKLVPPFNQDNTIIIGPANSQIWEQVYLPYFLNKQNNPLLINFTGLGPVFYENKILTIHDLSFWEHPEWFSKKYYWFYRIFTPISVRNSKKIITVSEYSKNRITKYLHQNETDIEVVYNAVNYDTIVVHDKQKYILSVGSLDPRKNIERLINSFKKWNHPDYELLIIGGRQNSFANLNLSSDNKIKFLGYLSDDELHQYYLNAEIFIFPSLHEGFGIPPLEAMACGTPVIASNTTSIPEACGDAAYYIDPNSEESMVAALDVLANNENLRSELIRKGFRNIKRFSWAESAIKINDVAKKLNL